MCSTERYVYSTRCGYKEEEPTAIQLPKETLLYSDGFPFLFRESARRKQIDF
jgi:hypothetical protein